MKLPAGGEQPARVERNRIIEASDRQNHKKDRDLEIGQARLILTSPDGTRWSVTVDNSGVISATSI